MLREDYRTHVEIPNQVIFHDVERKPSGAMQNRAD
jgi:hypothetical protein